jgi:hypothetical protein
MQGCSLDCARYRATPLGQFSAGRHKGHGVVGVYDVGCRHLEATGSGSYSRAPVRLSSGTGAYRWRLGDDPAANRWERGRCINFGPLDGGR